VSILVSWFLQLYHYKFTTLYKGNKLANFDLFLVSRILVALMTVLERFGDLTISW
jgi:hypothetical protein